MKELILFLTALSFYINLPAQQQSECQKVATGRYYLYPKGSNISYEILRDKKIQAEIVIGTHDTTFFKVDWFSSCEYSLTFLRSTKFFPPEVLKSFKEMTLTMTILNISGTNYTYKAVVKDNPGAPSLYDTVWFKKKLISQATPHNF